MSVQVLKFTLQWTHGAEAYSIKPCGDTVEISRRLHDLYRPMVSPALDADMQE